MAAVRPFYPSEIRRESDSSFRDLLVALDLQPKRILDVGAGGFVGATTTVHLLDLYEDAHLTAVELVEARGDALREKFGDRIEVVVSDVMALEADEPYDLIVIDLDTVRIPFIFERLLPLKVPELAAPGAVVVTDFLSDYLVAFGGANALPPENALFIRDHLLREFGRLAVTDVAIKKAWRWPGYEPVVSVEKWRADPNNFVAWLALSWSGEGAEELQAVVTAADEEAARGKRQTVVSSLAAQAAKEGPARADLVVSREACGPTCARDIAKWSEWCCSFAGGFFPAAELGPELGAWPGEIAEGEVVAPETPVALLEIPESFDAYLAAIGPKSRNMLRKAERLGYEFREFEFNDFLDDVYDINTSMPVRSGRPMSAKYLERPQPIRLPTGCALHRHIHVGAFQDGHLRAYCWLVIVGELAIVNVILGHGDALPDGVMNGLVAEIVRSCLRSGTVRYVNYLTFLSSTEGLIRFKKSVGFSERVLVARIAR